MSGRSVRQATVVGAVSAATAAGALAALSFTSGVASEPEHHTLKITTPVQNPSPSAKQDFLNLLADCTKQNLSFGQDGETVVDGGEVAGLTTRPCGS